MATRRALLASGLGLALALALAPTSVSAAPDRQVLLVVVPELSYEQALADPTLMALARAGGIGLMTTAGRADDPSKTAVNLGAGRSADEAPPGPVPFSEGDGSATVDVAPYVDAAGEAEPGLLGSTLAGGDLLVGYIDPATAEGAPALLVAMDRRGTIPQASFAKPIDNDPAAAAVVTNTDLVVTPSIETISEIVAASTAGELLVVFVGAGASETMHDLGDTVAPIVVARGSPEELLGSSGEPTGLTSITTRRAGVVSDVDVAPTILGFLGVTIPDEMVGSPIRMEGSPPTDLHERYLDFRTVVGPVGTTILWLALVSLFVGLPIVFVGHGRPTWLASLTAFAMLLALSLYVATAPASLVPSFSFATVVGALIVVAAVVLLVALLRGRADPRAAVAVVAVAGLGLVVLDGVLGWPSQLTPLLGGGVFDGERFYGLGNSHAGILLVGAVLGAARLPRRPGVVLIASAAVFAALPFLGADLGGCLTLAIAAGLWSGIGRWRLGWRTWALAAAAAVAALVFAVLADRVLPGGGTHVTRASNGGVLEAFVDRLIANVRTTSANASAWLAVLGLPFWFVLSLQRPRALAPTLEGDERWRDAILVLTVSGIAGYLLNDTHGLAGAAFAFASAAMLYPTLAVSRRAPLG